MADLRDFTGKNKVHTGATGITVSSGATTGNRVDSTGRLRFNTSTNLLEYYTGNEWKPIDSPPTINTIAVDGGSAAASAFIDNTLSGNTSIVIAGSLFDTSNAVVQLVANSGANITPASTTINNSSQITIAVPYTDFVNANEPYGVKVTNPSGLNITLEEAIRVDTVPTFTNAADTTFSIYDSARGSVSITPAQLCGATDAESDTLTYSITIGSLPSGLTLNTSTGAITGSTSAVGSDTTSTFTIQVAQTGGGSSSTRQFKITLKAPATDTFTSSGTFAVPAGVTTVDVLVVGGGGGSAHHHAGGGGAGGLIYRPGFTVSPATSIPVTVGDGAPIPGGAPKRGSDSVFSTLTAKGGGGGRTGGFDNGNMPGGSGSGGSHNPSESRSGGSATQPSQPGDSGNYGFGNPGGGGNYNGNPGQGAQGGGGGGAGAAGNTGGTNTCGNGGAGRQYAISGSNVYYSGGGAGGGHANDGSGSGGVGGGGNHGPGGSQPGQPGVANRGGGGGGSSNMPGSQNPGGGSGIVIVTY